MNIGFLLRCIKRCVDKLKLIFEQEQALRQANVSGSLEFGKPQMNIAALEAKMKKFFDTVSTDELIERFEKYALQKLEQCSVSGLLPQREVQKVINGLCELKAAGLWEIFKEQNKPILNELRMLIGGNNR